MFIFFSSRRRHTRSLRDWSSDVCSSDLLRRPLMSALRSSRPNRKSPTDAKTAIRLTPAATARMRRLRILAGRPNESIISTVYYSQIRLLLADPCCGSVLFTNPIVTRSRPADIETQMAASNGGNTLVVPGVHVSRIHLGVLAAVQ